MSAQINASILKNFIVKTIGADKLTSKTAQEYKIDKNDFDKANKDENNYLELDEILDDSELYEKFATLYVEDLEKQEDTKDAEKEKEENTKVKDKNGAGV